MKVLFLGHCFPRPDNPILGVWALGQLQALARAGVELHVMSFGPYVPKLLALTPGAKRFANCPESHQWDNLTAHYPRWAFYPVGPMRRINDKFPSLVMELVWLSARGAIKKAIRQFKPDVIYAHHSLPNGYLAYRAHQTFGVPYVVTDHDFDEIAACQTNPSRKKIMAKVANNAATMVGVCNRMQQLTQQIFPQAHTAAVLNGTVPIPKDILNNPRPAEWAGKQVIFSTGNFYQRKGIPLLVEAFALMAKRMPNVLLRIVGDGADRPQVEALIKLHNIHDRVTLLGGRPHREVLQEMAWCDMFALIGWDEPFGVVYAEAMSLGKPILCSSDCGINDVGIDGVFGRSVPPKNAIAASEAMIDMLSHPDKLTTMGAAAAKMVQEKLTWEVNAEKMKGILVN